ncbi:MAG: diguanylate cyclase [Candidatus Omnitrophota bacterium]|jgi:diguanylate cyclase (GGDEF)-like protein|nr:diguanylate cyclase [Candidatus Omnitrophota bacterium]MDD5137219.1 diguanylate cyclase [Candidatus Omnitrophota bacterium]MDD5538650.1 diguanylate cyclase [Candidatus Omnitrophota bacterium]
MANLTKKLSIASRSLRPQLIIAFCLMSIIPILALLNFVFPSLLPKNYLAIIIFAIVIMSLLGFIVVKRIVDPIIEINSEVKVIASGELSHQINISREDEIGELSHSLNQMTQRIKNNMDELKIYGERTKDINLQINRQVIALNGLLQISNLITKNAHLKDVYEVTISKLAQMANSSLAILIFKKDEGFEVSAQYGLGEETVSCLMMASNSGLLFHLLAASKPFLKVDDTTQGGISEEFMKLLGARNLLVYPILMQGKPHGIIAIGNMLDKFKYSNDDVELMSIFAKQLSIAVENDFLTQKVRDLEVKDALTGLFNKRYITVRFEEEIMRAISLQEPCSFVAVVVNNMQEYRKAYGDAAADDVLVRVAALLKSSIREIDRAARLDEGVFGIVLPQKNKRQAEHVAEQFKDKLRAAFQGADMKKKVQFGFSIVENPIDGADSLTLLRKAMELSGAGITL